MEEREYTLDDIEVLDSVTAIRRRPSMYVGPLDLPSAVNALLAEGLCLALDAAATGCATQVDITLHGNGAATVRHNGPGLGIHSSPDGLTAIEKLLTQLYACREAKRTKINARLCGIGIVITNALSESLLFETVHDGWLWQQQFSRGHAKQPILKQRECSERWEQITFRPDPEFFGINQLSNDFFVQWFSQQPFDLGAAEVTLHCENTVTRLTTAPIQGD